MYLEVSKKLDELTEPFYLCGLSLGGLLTLMYITRKRNDNLKGIIVSGAIYKSIPNWLSIFQSFVFKIMPKSNFQSMGLSKKQVINLMKSVDINLETDLAKVELPSLIICGEKDRINMKSSKEINKLIKNSNLQIIDNAGHEINKEQPLKFAEVLNNFIN
ncbi:serine aminopeptidase domain-containing protein [Vagococcus fluvialis]|nr:alpha/beta hydrolase [Vagococcus fluvialis]UDM75456.1 alpha/beta hydrolase [Vagococcus fluvialis]